MLAPNIIDSATGEVFALPGVPASETRLALYLPDDLPFEDWCRYGERISQLEKGVQWWLGDWWAFGSHRYGERAKVWASGIFGRAFQTLRNAGSVARQFETSRRRDVLSWSHHAEVAALDPDEADRLLDEAEREGWTRRDIRQRVSQLRSAEQLPGETFSPDRGGQVQDLFDATERGLKFGTIYADPPWLYDNQGTRASTGNHYGGMTIAELCELPVGELAADASHLHLWTTNAFLFECPKLFDAWGFEFRSSFVWVKTSMGIGNYWRNSHEILLTAIRGDAKRFNDRSLKSWLECDRGRHSAKPEQVRHYIERASPGPYLELFARSKSPGWSVWGNQVERGLLDLPEREVA